MDVIPFPREPASGACSSFAAADADLCPSQVLSEIDILQDQVLKQLDELNARVEAALAAFGGADRAAA